MGYTKVPKNRQRLVPAETVAGHPVENCTRSCQRPMSFVSPWRGAPFVFWGRAVSRCVGVGRSEAAATA